MTRVSRGGAGMIAAAILLRAAVAFAAPPGATEAKVPGAEHPDAVHIRRAKDRTLYTDTRGMTLYMVDQRMTRSRSGATLKYCIGPCQRMWSPLAAPAGAGAVGRWQVVDGAEGPQWSYKGNLVFTYRPDAAPGATGGDSYDDIWSVIPYIPPEPGIAAPSGVSATFVDGGYVLVDADGHALFFAGAGKTCGTECAGWRPLEAGLSARNFAGWSVVRGAERPHWAYRGRAVYVSEQGTVPPEGAAVRP